MYLHYKCMEQLKHPNKKLAVEHIWKVMFLWKNENK